MLNEHNDIHPRPSEPFSQEITFALCDYFRQFGVQDQWVFERIVSRLDWLLKYAHPDVVDKTCADELVAHVVCEIRGDIWTLTAEQHYELERYIDFQPEAYDKAEKWFTKPKRGRPAQNQTDGQRWRRLYE